MRYLLLAASLALAACSNEAGATGPEGPEGPAGPAGPKGDQGDKGDPGDSIQGPAGPAGASVEMTPIAVGDATCPQGGVQLGVGADVTVVCNGAPGDPGAAGAQGPMGPTGLQGPMGPQGPVGATGAQGAMGSTGAQGATGATGAQGATGAMGPTGADGPTGAQGATGTAGAQGAMGPTGAQGASGAMGPTGADGIAGAQGPAGPQGPVGPTGAQGTMGPTGAQGTMGPTGAQGAMGPTGPQGPMGAVGPTGANGAVGAQGPAGPQGPVGPTGAQGPIGAQGATGAMGPTGADGLAGAQGPAGPMGPTGAQGPLGATGPAGPAGPMGPTGPAGAAAMLTPLANGDANCPYGGTKLTSGTTTTYACNGPPGVGGSPIYNGGVPPVTFAGYTPQSYAGNLGGRSGAHALCDAAFTGSHFCTDWEIDRASPPQPTSSVWVDAGEYDATNRHFHHWNVTTDANTCGLWTTASATAKPDGYNLANGTIYNTLGHFKNSSVSSTDGGCENARPLACCLGGTAVRFRGFTPSTTGGNLGGRTGANATCNSAFAGSHFCSDWEVDQAAVPAPIPTSGAWVDNGEYRTTTRFYRDDMTSPTDYDTCGGWTTSSATVKPDGYNIAQGTVLTQVGALKSSYVSTTDGGCETARPVACCDGYPPE